MRRSLYISLFFFLSVVNCFATDHPCLLFDKDDVKEMKAGRSSAPLFDTSLKSLMDLADASLDVTTDVPRPEGGVGSPVSNLYKAHKEGLLACGVAYQFTSDRKYSDWIRDVLLGYSAFYPELGYHPYGNTAEPGRLNWQVLDDFVWTVNAIIAYDCVYDSLRPRDRKTIEECLFRPMAEFYMEGTEDNRKNNRVFNMMHNHGTWDVATVGMIGMVLGDEGYVEKSLKGTDLSSGNGGFFKQIETLFSPGGYYMEGAYYQRYALYPFLLYAYCLDRLRPEADVFHRHGGALLKSGMILVNMGYQGQFFNMNDAADMRYSSWELVTAFDVIYNADPSQKQLLGVIRDWHSGVMVSAAGFRTACDIAAGQAEAPVLVSCCIPDGPEGDHGATMVLRTPEEGATLTMKANAQGNNHGHFDKLTIGYFDNGNEVLEDYGFARFVALGIKNNGAYTRENRSYAMTTVAHNTLVVDEASHFEGVSRTGMQHWPEVLAFNADDPDFQYMAARDTSAYPGVVMERWTATVTLPFLEHPLIIDILRADSEKPHSYDYPLHYKGQVIRTNVKYGKAMTQMCPLGVANGYQHLWVEAEGSGVEGTSSFTWLCGDRFYTISTATTPSTKVEFLRTGASDPDFNLESKPVYMLRERGTSHCFASCLESHGEYVRHLERADNPENACRSVTILRNDRDAIVVR